MADAEGWQLAVAAGLLFVLFVCIGWPRRRPAASGDAAVRKPTEFEAHLVPLTECGSAAEAEQLAVRLRRQGIVALPKVEVQRTVRGGQYYVSGVVVASTDLGRAQDALAAIVANELPAQGGVPDDVIERELEAGVDDGETDAGVEPDARRSDLRRLGAILVLLALLGLAVAGVLLSVFG